MARLTPKARGGLDNARSAQLLRQIARGDRASPGELYDGYAPVVLAIAQRMLGTRSAAEELVQEVFVEVWQRAGEYSEQRASIHTQLLLRTRARALARGARALGPTTAARGRVRASCRAAGRARARLLRGYTSHEIADKLAVPVATVKERMASAIARLRLQLDEA